MRIYFDFEFTGLRQMTTPISLGCAAEDGSWFYAQFIDYDETQVDDWIRQHVINHLWYGDHSTEQVPDRIGTREQVAEHLTRWLKKWERVEMCGDCLAYDWVLFCELFGGAFGIPKNVYYIPFDLATVLMLRGIDPDINREEFAGMTDGGPKHNALWDARVIRACFAKLEVAP